MKRIANIAYSAIGGGILLLAGMPPFPANATRPPACVTANEDTGIFTDTVTVTNGCKRRKRVRAIIDNASDSSCNSLSPGESFTHRYPSVGKFEKLVNC
jgi:hypothetical protein